jgi:MFS family permease
MVGITLAHVMTVLDGTMMFVALPSLGHNLHVTVAGRQWVITAYTLGLAGLLLPGGRIVARLGARRTLLIGALGFAVASALGGAASDGGTLIAARAAQGAMGALLVSSTKANLISGYAESDERMRMMAIFSAAMAAGGIVGFDPRRCHHSRTGLALVYVGQPAAGAHREHQRPASAPRPARPGGTFGSTSAAAWWRQSG